MRAWPMSEEGLLSFTSLPMSKNPVGSPESTSESPSSSPAGLYSSSVPQRERGVPRTAAPRAGPGRLTHWGSLILFCWVSCSGKLLR